MEGIRAAQLSGFLICVHVRVNRDTELGEVAELIRLSQSLEADGIMISPASRGSSGASPDAAALQRKTAEARKQIGSKWWESFSRLVEPILSGERMAVPRIDESVVHLEQQARANEEGVKIA